ncbi:unnamed protein product [Rotaria magnacalcarata]|uniref:Uncharacterized protein n=1 Tax=Rotaria magnacalcarata TaxID=392030 RepID=A0A816H5C1_9BILA|nr:unnamed protein product [Rotaria magnacalcarata]CAF1684200.1 unnamed protein product [Rotaria magnacalcarata]CAF2184294.1 unnamed protein product [Rotaria magnacalcarata]CAF3995306.1 unnamed protein product [Rotaria magnacalcarata]CAF4216574.1 unnamed protein product [Rotaria magnacalcarata]
MASSNKRVNHLQTTTAIQSQHYFLITITNYPNVLQRTQQYQQPPNHQYLQQHHGAVFAPNQPIRIGMDDSDQHETFLYNTLRFELEESIRAYLRRTRRLYPINLVFDLSSIGQQRQ